MNRPYRSVFVIQAPAGFTPARPQRFGRDIIAVAISAANMVVVMDDADLSPATDAERAAFLAVETHGRVSA